MKPGDLVHVAPFDYEFNRAFGQPPFLGIFLGKQVGGHNFTEKIIVIDDRGARCELYDNQWYCELIR